MHGQLLLEVHKKDSCKWENQFWIFSKRSYLLNGKRNNRRHWGLEIKNIIRPYVEVFGLHQALWSSHKCKWFHYRGSPYAKWTPNHFWQQEALWWLTHKKELYVVVCYLKTWQHYLRMHKSIWSLQIMPPSDILKPNQGPQQNSWNGTCLHITRCGIDPQNRLKQCSPRFVESKGIILNGKTPDQNPSTKGHLPRRKEPQVEDKISLCARSLHTKNIFKNYESEERWKTSPWKKGCWQESNCEYMC